jgi:hypothetical protein
MPPLLAETTKEIQEGYKSLIFTGVFIVACLVTAIWWLRR